MTHPHTHLAAERPFACSTCCSRGLLHLATGGGTQQTELSLIAKPSRLTSVQAVGAWKTGNHRTSSDFLRDGEKETVHTFFAEYMDLGAARWRWWAQQERNSARWCACLCVALRSICLLAPVKRWVLHFCCLRAKQSVSTKPSPRVTALRLTTR